MAYVRECQYIEGKWHASPIKNLNTCVDQTNKPRQSSSPPPPPPLHHYWLSFAETFTCLEMYDMCCCAKYLFRFLIGLIYTFPQLAVSVSSHLCWARQRRIKREAAATCQNHGRRWLASGKWHCGGVSEIDLRLAAFPARNSQAVLRRGSPLLLSSYKWLGIHIWWITQIQLSCLLPRVRWNSWVMISLT